MYQIPSVTVRRVPSLPRAGPSVQNVYENAFIVALIVRKVTAIFVDSLHVGHE